MSDLKEWRHIANHSTSGDMVWNILMDWQKSEDALRKQLDDSNRKLEQRIALEIDEHLKVVELQAKLDVATKGIIDAMTYITCPPGVWNILNTALAEINRIGGMNVQG